LKDSTDGQGDERSGREDFGCFEEKGLLKAVRRSRRENEKI
jgi:hypothetical protein